MSLLLPTSAVAQDKFIVTGLSKISKEYPWIEVHYPNYKLDIYQALTTDVQFPASFVELQKKHSHSTIELYLSDYLSDDIFETIVTAGVGITAAILSGGVAGVFSSFSSHPASRFKATLGENSYNAAVTKDDYQKVELPKSQKNIEVIRDQLYKHVKASFVEDALVALRIISKQIEKQQEISLR